MITNILSKIKHFHLVTSVLQQTGRIVLRFIELTRSWGVVQLYYRSLQYLFLFAWLLLNYKKINYIRQ